MAPGTARPVAIPLAGWAQRQLDALALTTRSRPIAELSAAALLGERAALNGFTVPGAVSAGGGCRLYPTRDGALALALPRADDRALLPALFGDPAAEHDDEAQLAARIARARAHDLVPVGRLLGLPIARLNERAASPAASLATIGLPAENVSDQPLVIDLSALWAGPLAARLLGLAGANVVKVESLSRPDAMREGDAALYARLNDGKASVALNLRKPDGRNALIALIRRARVVIEAARPRALAQLGVDADALVREVPGLAWITITGHGTRGDAGNWIGLGDDCGVAGGLSGALLRATGTLGFVGDAMADPLTGIVAANQAATMLARGHAGRMVVSMSGVVRSALAAERRRDPLALTQALRDWAAARGQPFGAAPC
ncbi:CoA transferase [Novosphingobium sp.]|uniref:CoA transferase n=1 Tax=Novosphingobium sp. TaxID=1874826 RepID=UPI0025E26B3E|nr:CoA transferase [Novosphingobium sp.]